MTTNGTVPAHGTVLIPLNAKYVPARSYENTKPVDITIEVCKD